jgi:spore photoproduct lyase
VFAVDQYRGLRAGRGTLGMDAARYADKLSSLESQTLLPVLDAQEADFIRRQAKRYRFTLQELRQVAQAARDLEMWINGSFSSWWQTASAEISGTDRHHKKALLARLASHLESVAAEEKTYPPEGFHAPPTRRVKLQERQTSREVLGLCPAYSEQTVCCGLHTLDAVRGCPFSCSYCTIQTFYGESAELESDLIEKLQRLEIDPDRRYHIGTGQASDSLVWGNTGGVLDALFAFAAANPNILLELKTKSDNVSYFVDRKIPANVVCSWTLNTETIIRNEEQGAAPLEKRLQAARTIADQRIPVGFHFHPMVYYQGWRQDYPQVVEQVLQAFSPREVSFISMGSVTMIKPVVREIRRRGGPTKILQMQMVQDHHGKLTYPDRVKLDLFQTLYSAFEPWQEEVFFYLCMETAAIWRQVFGTAYSANSDFEVDFLDRCLPPSTLPAGTALR